MTSRFQGHLLPHSNTGTVQEISEILYPGQNVPVHSSHGVHCSRQGETDCHTQGYKNPPVPRRLVGESQVPPNLSPAYTGFSENVSRYGLAGEFLKIRTEAQAGLRLCRPPVRPQVQSGPTHTGPVAEPSRKNSDTAIPAGFPGLAIHVLDRSANRTRTGGYRKH